MDATFHVDHAVFNYRTAAVMIKNDHVLLHKQVHEDHWALPGGRVEILEDSQTTVQREIKEELGWDIEVHNLLWVTENFFAYNERDFHEIGLYYHASPQASIKVEADTFYGEEGNRLIYQWVPLEELKNINLVPWFLKNSLLNVPAAIEHKIIKETYDNFRGNNQKKDKGGWGK
ncbi:NUDIX domain-containing protein [Sediminibacillus dalangtanensis]|uniref:NUDIX domain-containing protein n=1 Tax=Sediminibacillus dalangtanensis TaxID=2729421 RepID=A0ABX7VVV9_9BACI|nr:NUDIX hydrolase [Sediminibacillus dalangtanensis]QTN00684.1 NUDIX domain-containing protein [Sediminibacillus dalangtanensis]